MAEENDAPFMTVKEMVTEIRQDVKELKIQIDRIDRTGSIGTKAELEDHESRLRRIEQWMYGVPLAVVLGIASVGITGIKLLTGY